MRPLVELLQISSLESNNLLEQVVWEYLQPELSYSALEKAKFLSKEELSLGLREYIHFKTIPLWKSLLNESNVLDYLLHKESESFNLGLDFIKESLEFNQIKGKYNLQSNTFKFFSLDKKQVLEALAPAIDTQEAEILKEQFNLLEESLDQWVDAQLHLKNGYYQLIIGDKQEETSFWTQKLSKTIQSLTLASLLFSSVAMADDSKKAVDYATKAVMAQPEVKQLVDQATDAATKKAEEIIKETGTQIPITVIGYGVKLVKDKAVKINGKSPLKELPVDYSLSVGLDSYSVGLQGDNPLVKDSKYWLQNSGTNKENKVEFGVKFDF